MKNKLVKIFLFLISLFFSTILCEVMIRIYIRLNPNFSKNFDKLDTMYNVDFPHPYYGHYSVKFEFEKYKILGNRIAHETAPKIF